MVNGHPVVHLVTVSCAEVLVSVYRHGYWYVSFKSGNSH